MAQNPNMTPTSPPPPTPPTPPTTPSPASTPSTPSTPSAPSCSPKTTLLTGSTHDVLPSCSPKASPKKSAPSPKNQKSPSAKSPAKKAKSPPIDEGGWKLESKRSANATDNPLEEDAKHGPKLDVDGLIQLLMSSVSKNDKGQMVVKDCLTDPAIIEQIIAQAILVLKTVKSMLELKAPLFIVGDLHGQFTDLLRIFEMCGTPGETNYLFLGDYVDRGPHSLETICLLLLLKIRYPWRINMLRGNHECSAINRTYGFSDECEDRFQHIPVNTTVWGVKEIDMKGTQVWYRFQDVFNWLPFTALVNEKILCMHGGLSPNLSSVDQLLGLSRPIDPCEAGLHVDLLWSDPDPTMPSGEQDLDWGPSNRGISSHFSAKAVTAICRKLKLDMIVRAHQVVQDGYEFFANRRLVTLFSAPNYCGEYNNCGAVMHLDESLMISFKILKPVPGTPCRKKGTKSTEVNFDDIDIDALIDGSAE